jgi:hypothetical protein
MSGIRLARDRRAVARWSVKGMGAVGEAMGVGAFVYKCSWEAPRGLGLRVLESTKKP